MADDDLGDMMSMGGGQGEWEDTIATLNRESDRLIVEARTVKRERDVLKGDNAGLVKTTNEMKRMIRELILRLKTLRRTETCIPGDQNR